MEETLGEMPLLNSNVTKLFESTTIVKVTDRLGEVIHGEPMGSSRYQMMTKNTQSGLMNLTDDWNRKWDSFGTCWSEERQNYRNLYDTYKLFHASFEILVDLKSRAVTDHVSSTRYTEMCGVAAWSIYQNGKKCVDLLKSLRLISDGSPEDIFCKKFSETRNKLIEHNYNPKGLPFNIEPFIWGLTDTSSLLLVSIHGEAIEREYEAYVDYYQDYFELEKIIEDLIRAF